MSGLHPPRDSMRQECECKGYICLVCHILNLFLYRLKALGKMSVSQSRIKGNENVSTLSRSSHMRVWMSIFVCTLSHSHLTESLEESVNPALNGSVHIGAVRQIVFWSQPMIERQQGLCRFSQLVSMIWMTMDINILISFPKLIQNVLICWNFVKIYLKYLIVSRVPQNF